MCHIGALAQFEERGVRTPRCEFELAPSTTFVLVLSELWVAGMHNLTASLLLLAPRGDGVECAR